MTTYMTTVTCQHFMTSRKVKVVAKSAAKTRKGILKAIARRAVDATGTDCIDFKGARILMREGTARNYDLGDWRTYGTVTPSEGDYMFRMASDRVFENRYDF